MSRPESVPFTAPKLSRAVLGRTAPVWGLPAELARNEQSLGAYLERERGELLATGEGAALAELDKIHAAMLEHLGEHGGGSR